MIKFQISFAYLPIRLHYGDWIWLKPYRKRYELDVKGKWRKIRNEHYLDK